VETGQAKAETEAFVTDSYRKQMEVNKDGALATEVEERLNAQKTANAEFGMMGFYKNFMTKNTAVGSNANEAPKTETLKADAQAPVSTRDKIEDKLKALKARQEEAKRADLVR
jgi:hypothetical protein